MARSQFADIRWARKQLGKSQSEMSRLLGVSVRAVQSYEQGWRHVPPLVERATALLVYLSRRKELGDMSPCWEVRKCDDRDGCPTYELGAGDVCWMLPSTRCSNGDKAGREERLVECQQCPVVQRWLRA